MANLNDYLLVKDKDGKLKYYKDGRFFSLAEIKGEPGGSASGAEKKNKELKPVLSFDEREKTASKSLFTYPEPASSGPKAEIKTFAKASSAPVIKPTLSKLSASAVKPPAAKPSMRLTPLSPKAPTDKNAAMARLDKMIRGEAVGSSLLTPKSAPRKAPSPPAPVKTEPFVPESLPPAVGLSERRVSDQRVIDEQVNALIAKMKIKFSEEKVKTRFVNIVSTYFRGIRGRDEVEYVLTLPKESGGLALPADKAKIIGSLLAHYADEAAKSRKTTVAKPVIREQEPAAVLPKQTAEPKDLPVLAPSEKIVEPEDKPVLKKLSPPSQPAVLPAKKESIPETPVGKAAAPMRRPTVSPRPHPAEDVSGASRRLVGPLDELNEMNLDRWQSLGGEPAARAEKIARKTEIIAAGSLVKKLAAVKAWRGSPVFHLYLAMSWQGLKENLPIVKVIEKRQFANEETLSLSDYEVIGELNKRLAI